MIDAENIAYFSIGALTSIMYILWDMGKALKRMGLTIEEELK